MAACIDRDTLHQWIRDGVAFELVDTLTREPYERHHLPGAIHIVSDRIEEDAPVRPPDRERTVMVYCGSTACKRSEKSAARLEGLDYADVREYVEGRRDWAEAGLPIETGPDPRGRP